MKNLSCRICRQNQNTHFMFSNFFSLSKIAPFMRMWRNIVETGGLQMTIWRIRIACWMPRATNTYSEYVIHIALPLQQWLHERTLVLRCTYTAFLVLTEAVRVYCAVRSELFKYYLNEFLAFNNNNTRHVFKVRSGEPLKITHKR